MTKEKQIEEMAHSLCCQECGCAECESDYRCEFSVECEILYNAGYRKQSEGEWRSELIRRCDWKGREQQYFQPNSCSICHNAVATRTPFCPNCGAKMKGGAE